MAHSKDSTNESSTALLSKSEPDGCDESSSKFKGYTLSMIMDIFGELLKDFASVVELCTGLSETNILTSDEFESIMKNVNSGSVRTAMSSLFYLLAEKVRADSRKDGRYGRKFIQSLKKGEPNAALADAILHCQLPAHTEEEEEFRKVLSKNLSRLRAAFRSEEIIDGIVEIIGHNEGERLLQTNHYRDLAVYFTLMRVPVSIKDVIIRYLREQGYSHLASDIERQCTKRDCGSREPVEVDTRDGRHKLDENDVRVHQGGFIFDAGETGDMGGNRLTDGNLSNGSGEVIVTLKKSRTLPAKETPKNTDRGRGRRCSAKTSTGEVPHSKRPPTSPDNTPIGQMKSRLAAGYDTNKHSGEVPRSRISPTLPEDKTPRAQLKSKNATGNDTKKYASDLPHPKKLSTLPEDKTPLGQLKSKLAAGNDAKKHASDLPHPKKVSTLPEDKTPLGQLKSKLAAGNDAKKHTSGVPPLRRSSTLPAERATHTKDIRRSSTLPEGRSPTARSTGVGAAPRGKSPNTHPGAGLPTSFAKKSTATVPSGYKPPSNRTAVVPSGYKPPSIIAKPSATAALRAYHPATKAKSVSSKQTKREK